MFELLGGFLVFYIIYALFALIFKHLAGYIIAGVLSLVGGIVTVIASGSPFLLLSSLVGLFLVLVLEPIHIRDKNKIKKSSKNSFDDFNKK